MKRYLFLLTYLPFLVLSTKAETLRNYYPAPTTIADTVITLQPTRQHSPYKAVEFRASLPDYKDVQGLYSDSYGISFGSPEITYTVSVTPGNQSTDNLYDHRYISLTITSNSHRGDTTLNSFTLYDNVGLGDAHNSLAVELDCSKQTASIFIGNSFMRLLDTLPVKIDSTTDMSIFANGRVNIDLLVDEIIMPDYPTLPSYTLSTLIKRFNSPEKMPIEGYWKYLDRDTDNRYSRLGGSYNIAVIFNETTSCFDIVYIDGAHTNSDHWITGMIKGQLRPTIFDNHFDLLWYDSMFQPYSNESHAQLLENTILSLSFPLLESSIRFYPIKN